MMLARIINGMSRRTSCRDTRSGIISAESPRVTRMLKILLPMTLPTAMSAVSLSAACRLTVIWGALLPIATTVKPTRSGRTQFARNVLCAAHQQLRTCNQQHQAAEQL